MSCRKRVHPDLGRMISQKQSGLTILRLPLAQKRSDVEPESYVLPPEYEVGSPVAWEKTNPNCYRSVGSVRSFHPSWNGRPSSKSKETSEPKGGEGAQQQENELVTGRTPPPVENDAAQVMERVPTTVERTDPKSGETVEKVPSPMADVKAILKEIDSEFPATEEDERYDSCKDDMSTDSQIQENRVYGTL
ncbi:hypothetical protein Bca52824_033937 [Brassica carinata]|uniref:Uncharacterized protein n=1 Tax=Brassica carinata TaxID=52824 RepID=A0A8X7V9R0_BRACI|nr:hypothetical protein Bca52824_033937 [Brassica carinata]